MYKFSTKGIVSRRVTIKVNNRRVRLLILSPVKKTGKTTGVMWIHGGGYMTGINKEFIFSTWDGTYVGEV